MTDLQHILVYVAVLLAAGFLVKKFVFSKKKTKKACGKTDCGCH
ncbi:MAG: FeoB-associated Cys-rich membrane protein [Sinomicrobium sp.]|nr:FeoB-associated Cys-rich membrane protein [Sinomicrobium sp.]